MRYLKIEKAPLILAVLILALEAVIKPLEAAADPGPRDFSAAASVDCFARRLEVHGVDVGANTVYSPVGVGILLALLSHGANGQTATELSTAVCGRQAYDALARVLPTTGTSGFTINIGVWTSGALHSSIAFSEFAMSQYRAVVRHAAEGQDIATLLRAWVRAVSGGDMTLPAMASPLWATASVAAFRGQWEQPFSPAYTTKRSFHGVTRTALVPMMQQNGPLEYAANEHGILIVKDYKPAGGEHYAFMAFLPADRRASPLSGLLGVLNERTHPMLVSLRLPRFRVYARWNSDDMIQMLRATGVRLAFSRSADFTPIIERPHMGLNFALEEAWFSFDEHGSRAQAATIFDEQLGPESPYEPTTVTFDRPFAFAVVDTTDRLPLFLGGIVEPPLQ